MASREISDGICGLQELHLDTAKLTWVSLVEQPFPPLWGTEEINLSAAAAAESWSPGVTFVHSLIYWTVR